MIYSITIYMLVSQALFAKAFVGPQGEYAWSIVQTSDGGYAVAGWTNSFGAGGDELLVLKLTSSGGLSWDKTFGGTAFDGDPSIIQTSDGGCAVAGYTNSFGAGVSDCLVLKLTGSGDLSWAKTFGGANYDDPYSIIQTSDGGYALAGYTNSFGAGGHDFLVLKLTGSGDLQWAKTFGGTLDDEAWSITQTSDGGYALAGWTWNFGARYQDFFVLKITSSGDFQWAKRFGGADFDYAYSIIQTSDGGYAVLGETKSFGAGRRDFLVLKLTGSGDLSWAKTFGGTNDDYPRSIIQTSDGGYALAGWTLGFGAGNTDVLVLKLTGSGDLSWAKTFGGANYDYARSIIQTSDGGYAVAGETGSFGGGGYNVLVLKIGPDGSYPGCVADCSPTVSTVTPDASSLIPSTSSLSLGADCSPTITTPTLATTNACTPGDLGESDLLPGNRLTCSAFSGGLVFNAPADLVINIYSVDGRVAYSGQLQKGENRISLDRGVYLWQAGTYRGKAAVR